MDEETNRRGSHGAGIVQRWEHRLDEAGLGEVGRALAWAMRPLAPLAAQLVWIAQPGLGLLGEYESAGALAEWLDDAGARQKKDSEGG